MKLTDEQLRIVAAICKNHRYSNNDERYQWSSEIFLAGCAWQQAQDAKIVSDLRAQLAAAELAADVLMDAALMDADGRD